MKKKPILLQVSINADDTLNQRYIILIKVIEGEVPKLHFIPVPSWLGYHSAKYKYQRFNLD